MGDLPMTAADCAWTTLFPRLASLEPATAALLTERSRIITIPAGTVLFHEGDACQNFVLVLDGQIRVQKVAESGREIVLYRVESGQGCVLTTSCLMTEDLYMAEGVAETEVRAVIIGRDLFNTLLGQSDGFRRFVFSAYASRIADLLMLIEEVAFGRIDMRLAQCLLDKADASGGVRATHQDLSVELGTAREVVSRQLKEFERHGWLALGRGQITLSNPGALRQLATSR